MSKKKNYRILITGPSAYWLELVRRYLERHGFICEIRKKLSSKSKSSLPRTTAAPAIFRKTFPYPNRPKTPLDSAIGQSKETVPQ